MSTFIWKFAEFEFHENSRELRRGNEVLILEAKPKEVLLYLLQRTVKVVETDEILRAVWKASHLSEATVPVAVKKIRDAFGDPNRERIIRTVKGTGYAFNVEVTRVEAQPRPMDPMDELRVGQFVPGRTGWVLTQQLGQDRDGATWLSKKQFDPLRVVRLAWTEDGLARLRAEADAYDAVERAGNRRGLFSKVLERQFDSAPYLLETEFLGAPLPRWAKEHGGLGAISEGARVGIVADVAAALDVLHRAGQVHGDLSAATVHLLPDGESWIVRLDGIGRYVKQIADQAGEAVFRLGPGAGTEQSALYRAPELEPGQATVAGDIYALGVLLYQCTACTLTENPVLGWDARIADPVLRRDIVETANIDPTLRIRSSAGLAEGLRELATRRSTAEELATSRKAAELAQQQLAAELAKRPLRRALIGSLILLAVAIAGGGFLEISALRRDRAKAREQNRQAQSEEDFFQQLLFDGDAVHGPITAEALAQRGLDKLRLLEGEPQIHASLLNTVGSGFEELGDYPKAESVLQRALDERTRLFGPESPEVAETLIQQAALKEDEHEAQQALQLGQRALALQKRALPSTDIAITRSETKIAEIWTDLGKYDQAVPLLEVAIRRETDKPELLPDLSIAYNDLGIAENYRGNIKRSLDLQERSMRIDKELFGDRHADIAEHLLSISNAHDQLGQYEQAAAESRESLSILQDWLPPGHHEVAAAQAHLGTELAHLPASLPEARKYLELALQTLIGEPERSPTEAYAYLSLARVDHQQHRDAEALEAYRRSLSIYKLLFPQPQYEWAVPLAGMASVYYDLGQSQPFADSAQQAFDIASATLPADDPRRLNTEVLMARLRIRQQRFPEAETLLQNVLARSPEGSPRTQQIRKDAQNELVKLKVSGHSVESVFGFPSEER